MAYKQLKLWFDQELGKMLADKIITHYPSFDKKKFVAPIKKGVENLELKDRVEFIADLLNQHLPQDYKSACTILTAALGPENELETGMFTEFYWVMPIAKYVEKYGLEHYGVSMKIIEEITKRNTSEYCIRPFIEKYPDKVSKRMLKWTDSKNFHLRRLASEGIRSRLPWAKKMTLFNENPQPVIDILEKLKADSSKFVQKSVANNINDILKDNYPVGIKLLKKWAKPKVAPETKWIVKHALRNERKKENPEALKIIKSMGA